MARLQQADEDRPVLIPGARETRVSRSSERPPAAGFQPAGHAATADLSDRASLDREREGGGAPSERSGPPQRTVLARLGDWFGRGIEMLRPAPGVPPAGVGS